MQTNIALTIFAVCETDWPTTETANSLIHGLVSQLPASEQRPPKGEQYKDNAPIREHLQLCGSEQLVSQQLQVFPDTRNLRCHHHLPRPGPLGDGSTASMLLQSLTPLCRSGPLVPRTQKNTTTTAAKTPPHCKIRQNMLTVFFCF